MARKHYTDVIGTLGSGGLTNVATTHTFTALTYVNGTAVPTLAAGESFLLSILDASGNVLEVINVTAWNSGTKAATIARAQEGYAAVAHAGSLSVANSVYPSDMGGVGSGIIGYCQYAPAVGLAKSTTSSTIADVDASNLVVTFTAPPSGSVLVTLSAYASISGGTGSTFRWGLRSGSTNLTGSFLEALSGLPAAPFSVTASVAMTGLTPGTSYTWKWAFYRNSGTSTCFIFAGLDADGGTSPAIMKVEALP